MKTIKKTIHIFSHFRVKNRTIQHGENRHNNKLIQNDCIDCHLAR
jgi:hypothetical protein